MIPEVERYLADAPGDQRAALEDLRALILRHFPRAIEGFDSRFPVYKSKDGEWLAGFAARKKGAMFYLMDEVVLDAHEDEIGKLRSGQSCVEYKATQTRTLAELRELVDVLLAESAQRRKTAKK